MSGTTESLRRKIAGATDLEAVVRSMKALAASSVGQYERAAQSLNEYYYTVELGLAACLRRAEPVPSVANKSQSDGLVVGAIVFGSDQGLVGRFNEVLLEFATNALAKLPGKERTIWAVGERIYAIVIDSGQTVAELFSVPTSVHSITNLVDRLLIAINAARERGEIGQIHVFHNRPKSGAAYEPIGRRMLPLDDIWRSKLVGLRWPTKLLPDVVGELAHTLEAFVREYLFVVLFQACAESLCSENASRLAAMQRAEKNIEKILDELNRRFHRLRQQSIDEELFDVISGYEALSKAPRRESSEPVRGDKA